MNRTELIDAVASATGLEKKQAEAAVTAFVDAVVSETKAGNKVSIFGFGTFTPKALAARTGRNPQTGAPVKIPASKAVRFGPAAAYKTALNTKGTAKKAAAPAKKAAAPAKKAAAPAKKAAAPAKKAAAPAKKAVKATKKR